VIAGTLFFVPTAGAPTLRAHPVRTLEDRVRLLQKLVLYGSQAFDKSSPPFGSIRDPEMRRIGLAVTEVCKARDDRCELMAIYDFVKRNIRYTGDVTNKDTFQSAWVTMQMGGGDCFPQGTLFVTRDGFEAVEQLEVGDEIHDGRTWVPILKTWDRGVKTIFRAQLDNGNVLRLSDRHKVLRVPKSGSYSDAEEVRMADVRPGDDLLQPRQFDGASSDELDEATAFLVGAYLAEGCRSHKRVGGADVYISLAGVANGKMIRERAIEILKARSVPFKERSREIVFHAMYFEEAFSLGRTAIEKHLPTFRYGPKTIDTIVSAMNADGGLSTTGYNFVYSTISPQLALQYRVLKRMQGRSVAWKTLLDHGGAGKNAIHRLTVRAEATRRPWAKVRSVEIERKKVPSYDIMTSSGRVYLPEADVITRQCDDHAVMCAVLSMVNGFIPKFRITSNYGSSWDHIYCIVGLPKLEPRSFVALDTTLPGSTDARFGKEPPRAKFRDFGMGDT
jgi:hypothetical protein